METYYIEARTFKFGGKGGGRGLTHNSYVLRNSNGTILESIHGLAALRYQR